MAYLQVHLFLATLDNGEGLLELPPFQSDHSHLCPGQCNGSNVLCGHSTNHKPLRMKSFEMYIFVNIVFMSELNVYRYKLIIQKNCICWVLTLSFTS